MRISRNPRAVEEMQAIVDELRLVRGGGAAGRVCGAHCDRACYRCGGSVCQCVCSPYCNDAPHALSGDPAFPLEPHVAPLVYELKRTAFFTPCWSCEGHLAPDGALRASPSIWFYARAPIHVRLLSGSVRKLNASGRLRGAWRISLGYSDPDNPEVTFSLEPDPSCACTLADLQSDLGELARMLPAQIAAEAADLQVALGSMSR